MNTSGGNMLVTTLRCWWHSWRCWVVSGFYIIAIKASGVKILKIKILSATSYNCHQHTVFAKITAALSQSFWHLKIAWHRHNDGVITAENSVKRKLESQVHNPFTLNYHLKRSYFFYQWCLTPLWVEQWIQMDHGMISLS